MHMRTHIPTDNNPYIYRGLFTVFSQVPVSVPVTQSMLSYQNRALPEGPVLHYEIIQAQKIHLTKYTIYI